MALQRKRPSDDEILNNQAISEERVPGTAKDETVNFGTFDDTINLDKTTLDLDAFAPYKPTGDIPKTNFPITPDPLHADPIPLTPTVSEHDFDTFAGADFSSEPAAAEFEDQSHPKDFDPSTLTGSFEGSLNHADFDAGLLTEWSLPASDEDSNSLAGDSATSQRPSRLFVQIGKFSANYDVTDGELVIGRPDYVTDIHPEITIEWDDAISRRHARVFAQDGEHYLEDLGSTNGTKLNGILLDAHVPRILSDGDLINLGSKTELSYYK